MATESPTRYRVVVTCTWDDVPHLDKAAQERILASYPEYQADARSKGVPSLGSGNIYRTPESEIKIPPFALPKHFRRGYGFDVGWNRTAAAFIAYDPDTDIRYICDVHYSSQQVPSVHAAAIRARGEWMPGRIDPAARGRSQEDGEQLLQKYRDQGLNITDADHAVEAGILAVWELLSTGRLKVFSSCEEWFKEYRLYRRDEKGQIVKSYDHLMDATRYAILSGVSWLVVPPNASTGGYLYGNGGVGIG